MKYFICLMLLAVIGLPLAGCAANPAESTSVQSETVDTYDYPEINDKLTWEKINAFPIKTSAMSVEEMRELCVNFFRFTKTALWIPDDDFEYIRNSDGAKDGVTKGVLYGGLPYITLGTGNVYRLMDYINPETGVVDMEMVAQNPTMFGSQCSVGSYWAWGRVINSANHLWTNTMTSDNGFIPLGPYSYENPAGRFGGVFTTKDICTQNTDQVMYQSYAQLKPADGLVRYTKSSGHVIMCSYEAHVEYVPGTDRIDGSRSYIKIIDQTQQDPRQERTNESGDTFLHMSYVDKERTFSYLFEKGFIPFTFAEFLGTDPVEETECSFSFTGEKITVEELFSGKVTSNYGIADVYAIVKDSSGNEVYRHAVRATEPSTMELPLVQEGDNVAKWGELNVSKGKFTLEIQCQLATGERPTIYTGALVP